MREIKFLDLTHMHRPIRGELLRKFEDFYDNSWYVLGDDLKTFEKEYASFCQTRRSVGVANGLDALVLSLRVLGIKAGDEVIVPSNTYIATWLAVSAVGATPVPVEPNIATYNLNPDLLAAAITPRTKAVMPVHLYGQPCEMEAILQVATEHGIVVVEDNAQAHGATFQGKPTGGFGLVNGTSFYPGKNLGALGDGGAVTTNSDELADRIARLRNYGSGKKYLNEERGVNSRLDELQAGFLSIKLRHIDAWNRERRSLASRYSQRLTGISDLILPAVAAGADPVYHLYVVRTGKRDQLQEFLKSNGVETMVHYPVPPHLQKAYADHSFKNGSFPVAEEFARTSLSLPLYPGLEKSSIDFVAEKVAKFFGG